MRVTAMFCSSCSGTSGRPRSAPGSSLAAVPAVAAQVVAGDPVSAVEEEVPFLPPFPAHSRHHVSSFFLYGFGMILAGFFVCGPLGKDGCMGGSSDGLFFFLQGFGAFFASFSTHAKKRRPTRPPQIADKPFSGGLEGPPALQSQFVSPGFPRSLNLRGGRWPRPPLVSLPTFGSLCHLRWQQPTGLTLPSGAGRAGSLRPWAQTFLKHLAEKAAAGGLFR